MKRTLFFILAVLCVVSCKQSSGSTENSTQETAVGVNHNGNFEITDLENIKEDWQAALRDEHNEEELVNFTIVKGTTQGEVQQDYYILLAKNKNGFTKTAAMLSLKNDKFYFVKQEGVDSLVYLKILCVGECASGCDPTVTVVKGKPILICSPCPDCIKMDREMR